MVIASFAFSTHQKIHTLIFTKAYDQHFLQSESNEKYVRHNILFNEKLLQFDIYDKFPTNLNIIEFDDNENVIQIFEKMDYYCNKLSGDTLRRTLINLIEEVFLNILIKTNATLKNQKLENNSILTRAIHYIEEHLLEINNIEEICDELYISKSHLHHLFIEHLGISPKKYIITKRLSIAQRKICQGKKTTEVAEKCGFYDYSAFYRAYRKRFGYSPIETPRILSTKIDFEDIVKSYN